jgi:cullin-associated NEDD8-dissociated protein 1
VTIAQRLSSLILDPTKNDLRDVYTIGLKTLIQTVPMAMGDVVSQQLAEGLMDGIRMDFSGDLSSFGGGLSQRDDKGGGGGGGAVQDIVIKCLELLTELTTRFGALSFMTRQHLVMLQVVMRQLGSESELVQKRAGQTIGCLAVVISDTLLGRLVESLWMQIEQESSSGGGGGTMSMDEGMKMEGDWQQNKEQEETYRKWKARKIDEQGVASTGLMVADGSGSNGRRDRFKNARALIRTMCTIAGLVGHRLGQEQIDRLVPIFLKFCNPVNALAGDDLHMQQDDEEEEEEEEKEDDKTGSEMRDVEGDDEIDLNDHNNEEAMKLANELKEACLSGFESFVLRRPVETQPHLHAIIHAALAYMRHDPNYTYGDEEEERQGGSSDDDDDDHMESDEDFDADEDEYEDDEYDDVSDDDDDSWKVRRSAIRLLTGIVNSFARDPSKLWTVEYAWKKNKKQRTTVAGALVQRFKERDENCRVGIIECFTTLLSNTIDAASNGDIVLRSPDSMDVTTSATSQTIIDLRTKFVPIIVKGCVTQLSAKKAGNRTKSAALALLSTLSRAPGGIGDKDQIRTLFDHMKSILSGDTSSHSHTSNKSLKLDCLHCISVIITSPNHAPQDVMSCVMEQLLTELCNTLQDNWYKITSETLMVLTEIPGLLAKTNATKQEKDFVANCLYHAIEPRLAVHDADQEVKEASLTSSGSLLSILHDSLDIQKKDNLLSLILLRLKNETTRAASIRTIGAIVTDGVNISIIIDDVVSELAALLRQNRRSIKQASLQCLEKIITSSAMGPHQSMIGSVLKDLSYVIVDTDLHISHLSLQVCHSMLNVGIVPTTEINEHLLPAMLNLSKSSILQDKALDSLLAVLEKLVHANAVVFQELLVALKNGLLTIPDIQNNIGATRQSVANVAHCMAAITSAAPEHERNIVVSDLLSSIESLGNSQSTNSASIHIQLALRVAGDIGRRLPLGSLPGVAVRLQNIFMIMFESQIEDIKNSAAYGLGRVAVCSKSEFLPNILSALEEKDQKKQYLLLSALREFIHCHQRGYGGEISSSVPRILPHLFNHLADNEEGVRTMVADCLGSLACLEPSVILPHLQNIANEHSGGKCPTTCATVLTSMKYAIAGKCDTSIIVSYMPTFLTLLNEDDLSVKNAALLMIYAAVHHNPQLVLNFMQQTITPALHELAQLKQERVVDLGPFKQKVDYALPIRKAALSIFSTCLDKCPQVMDVRGFMPILALALGDSEDVQLQAHQILISTSSRYPNETFAFVESFVDPLEKTMNKKMGNKKGAELERATEWVKSAVRVMVVLSRVTDAMK